MQKRLDEEVRIFPNDESALRLIGALLAEQNKVWQEKHYLDMSECVERPPFASPPERTTTLLLSRANTTKSTTESKARSKAIYSRI